MNNLTGNPSAGQLKVVIVVSDFNRSITDALLHGAVDAFIHYGGDEDHLTIIRVPGAFEIPGAARLALDQLEPDAVVTLGAVIRGGTPHFDFVAGEVARGIADLSKAYDVPVLFGVLTTNTVDQARERAGTRAGNKGWDVMEAALTTSSVYRRIIGD